jgi:hypothetical protein
MLLSGLLLVVVVVAAIGGVCSWLACSTIARWLVAQRFPRASGEARDSNSMKRAWRGEGCC